MRKSSGRKPRKILQDPLGWVISGLQPVATAQDTVTLLRIKGNSAIESCRTGTATIQDIDTLIAAFNIAEALALLGQGGDWLDEIRVAQRALQNACIRPRIGFTGTELNAVNLVMQLHEIQLTDAKTTVQMMEEAIHLVEIVLREKRKQSRQLVTGAAA